MKAFLILAAVILAAEAQQFPTLTDHRQRIRAGVIIADGAKCTADRLIPAFFVSDNKAGLTDNGVEYNGLSEEQCTAICTDNLDRDGRPIVCASVTYNHITAACTVQRSKARPDGIMPLAEGPGQRYLEKWCMPTATAPVNCGEAHFRRVDQHALVGFARNAVVVASMQDCVLFCLDETEFPCKSAMYFPDDGECITNNESAEGAPGSFGREEKDKVVYIENGCLASKPRPLPVEVPVRRQAVISESAQTRSKPVRQRRPKSTAKPKPTRQRTQTAATPKTTTPKTTTPKTTTPKTTTPTPAPEGYTPWGDWSPCDRPKGGRRIRRRKCNAAKCTQPTMESQWCDDLSAKVLSQTTTTEEPTSRSSSRSSTRRPTTTTTTPLADGPWGPWEGQCHLFNERAPCVDGKRVGFERRPCRGSPLECQGPFFRYCLEKCT